MNSASQPSYPKSSSQATRKQTSDLQKKFKCLFYQRNPSDHQNHACKNTGYDDISTLRYHLTRVHTQGLGCECHTKNAPCDKMGEKLRSFDLRAAPYAKLTPDEKWITLFQELFPNDPIPSPYEEQTLTYEQERTLVVLLAEKFGKETVAQIYSECKSQALKQAPSTELMATPTPYPSATPYSTQQHPSYIQQPRTSSSQPTQTLPLNPQIIQQSHITQQTQINQQSRMNRHPPISPQSRISQQPQINPQPQISPQSQINPQPQITQQPQINQQPHVNQHSSLYQVSFTQRQPTMYSMRPTATPNQYSYSYNTRPSTTPHSYSTNYGAQPSSASNSYHTNYNYPPYNTE